MDNGVYLLIQIFLPFQQVIEVVRHIRSMLRPQKADLQDIPDDLLKGLTVFLIHGQQEEREHDEDHADRRRAGTGAALE